MKRIILGVITLMMSAVNAPVSAMETPQGQTPPVFIGNVVVPVYDSYVANQILFMNRAHQMVCSGQYDQARPIFNILKESLFPPVNLAAKNWLICLELHGRQEQRYEDDIATGAESLCAIMHQPESPLATLASLAVENSESSNRL